MPLRSAGGGSLSRENGVAADDQHVGGAYGRGKDALPLAYPSSQRIGGTTAASALSTGFNNKQGAPLGANVMSIGGSSTQATHTAAAPH